MNPHGGSGASGSGGSEQPIPPTNRGTAGGLRPSTAAAAQLLQQAQNVPVPGSLPNDPWQQQGLDPWAAKAAGVQPPGNPPELAYQQTQAWSGYVPPAKAASPPTAAQVGTTPSAGGP